MANISVHLLGRPYVEVDGERVNFPYKKAEGFFYYLCVKKTATKGRNHIRALGADNENVGRKNLREAVYQIKKLLWQGNPGDSRPYQHLSESGVYAGY